jgi:hypothetical protein
VQSTTLTADVAQLEVDVPRKFPVAAIYQPTLDAVSPVFSPFALNGQVTDPEDGDLPSRWTITGPGLTTPVERTGDLVDVAPPGGAWVPGDYTVTLRGTDLNNNTAVATAIVHVVQYAFGGFVSPIDNLPTINTGRAGRTYPVRWLHTSNGVPVTDPSSIVAIRFAPMNCGLAETDALETTASGGTELRFDATADLWVYNWKTPSTPGCYALTLTLDDGSTHVALFRLT